MPEGSASDFRRMPAVERTVSDISSQDIRVKVTGTVVDKHEDRIVLDDGTGKVAVTFEQPVDADVQKTVRVFGRVISLEEGIELQGEVVQNLEGFDLELWKKVKELETLKS